MNRGIAVESVPHMGWEKLLNWREKLKQRNNMAKLEETKAFVGTNSASLEFYTQVIPSNKGYINTFLTNNLTCFSFLGNYWKQVNGVALYRIVGFTEKQFFNQLD